MVRITFVILSFIFLKPLFAQTNNNCGFLFQEYIVEEIVLEGGSYSYWEHRIDARDVDIITSREPSSMHIPSQKSHDGLYIAHFSKGKIYIESKMAHRLYRPTFEVEDYTGYFIKDTNFWVMDKNPNHIYVWNFIEKAQRVLIVPRPEKSKLISVQYSHGLDPNRIFDYTLDFKFEIESTEFGLYYKIFKYDPTNHQQVGDPQIVHIKI